MTVPCHMPCSRPVGISAALLCLVLSAWPSSSAAADETVRDTSAIVVAVIGDSTVCDYPDERDCRGWGQYLEEAFQDPVQVKNLARSGRSTKTFLQEGRWKDTLAARPQFILIQFGHNDSHAPGRPESTDDATDFRDNLRLYVDEARAAGATPILVTPMHRRTFHEDGRMKDILRPYADSMQLIAAEKQVAIIDLHRSSGLLFQKLGEEEAARFANRPDDATHFNEAGARRMAALVLQELPTVAPTLARFLKPSDSISHSFLACGSQTCLIDGQGQQTWSYPHATRDGYVLPNGHVLLTLSRGKRFPGGAVVDVDPASQDEVVIWKGTQSEVNSAQPTAQNTFLITEAGPRPRLLEVDREGQVVIEFPLQCQTQNHHMQTRMARKLEDGTYLVPHLFDFALRHYDATGKVLRSIDTTVPGDTRRDIHSWPFTAIRMASGNTLVCCTNGNRVVEYDPAGAPVWQLTNDDLPEPWLQDPCGAQVLPNGNLVITSYAAGARDVNAPKLLEVTRDKQVVWTFRDGRKPGIHHFQILDTNGQALTGTPLR